MGLFDFFKKKEQNIPKKEHKPLLAMPMFNNGEAYKIDDVINDLKIFWKLTVSETPGDDEAAAFYVDGEEVAIGYIATQIPWGDIEGTAQYTYTWPTALDDLANHNGHAIVIIMSSNKSTLERFRILSKVLCSILRTSNAIGVYQGSQSLLIPRLHYLLNIDELKSDEIPLMLWVYIGFRKSEKGNSVYTYGLTDFQKQEMEIIYSQLDLAELHDFISNSCIYVIKNNIILKDGETIGQSAEQKIKITSSAGHFVEGQSFKLAI